MEIEVGIICTVLGLIISYAVFQRNGRKEIKDETEKDITRIVKMDVKLDSISNNVNEIRLENKEISKSVNALAERVTIVEQAVKTAHSRIDKVEKDGK